MFPTSPSVVVSSGLLAIGVLVTLGLELMWLVFAITLVTSILIALHRSIPRQER